MINLNKELVFKNIFDLINNGFFLDKYIELTTMSYINSDYDDYDFSDAFDESDIDNDFYEFDFSDAFDDNYINETNESEEKPIISNNIETEQDRGWLEDRAAAIFNAIIIGCQLFDDKERIERFVDMFSLNLDSYFFEKQLSTFGISNEEAASRLNHGFVVHFTTPKIAELIQKEGKLIGGGKNAMFTQEEDETIKYAEIEQKNNNPTAEATLNYLFRGWGTGVSSYGSTTNGFWMYHTPESLTFLFGDISKRDKNAAMMFVAEKTSSLEEKDKKIVYDTMSNIYDRLIGDEQNTCCILIDRDAFKYEVDYYYGTGTPVGVERRPFSATSFNSLNSIDSLISDDIAVNYLKFLKIPTIIELERQKSERLMDNSIHL